MGQPHLSTAIEAAPGLSIECLKAVRLKAVRSISSGHTRLLVKEVRSSLKDRRGEHPLDVMPEMHSPKGSAPTRKVADS